MKNKFVWIITALSFAVSAAAVNFLPDKIPVHYDLEGNIDRYGSKYEVFNYPVIILLIALVYAVILATQKKKMNSLTDEKKTEMTVNNLKVAGLTVNCIAAVQLVMQSGSVFLNIRRSGEIFISDDIDSFTIQMTLLSVCFGIMFIVLGNVLQKTKMNSVIGLRTESSMKNDMTWQLSNRFAGRAMMICGIITIILALAVKGIASVLLMLVLLVCAAIVSAVYASKTAEKYPENANKKSE